MQCFCCGIVMMKLFLRHAGLVMCLWASAWSSPVPLEMRQAIVGEVVQLNCTTRLTVPVDWWYVRSSMDIERKNVYADGKLVNGYRNKYKIDLVGDFMYILVIPNVSLSDSGIFTCTERGGVGDVLKRVNLIVSRNESFQMVPNGIVNTKEGSELEIVCLTGSVAPVDFRFFPTASAVSDFVNIFTDNRMVNTLDGRVSVETDSDEGRYKLLLRKLSSNMSGIFECVERGGLGPGRDRVRIVVDVVDHVSTDEQPNYLTHVETISRSPSDSDDDAVKVEIIVIICISSLLSVGVIAVVVWLIIKKRTRKAEFKNEEGTGAFLNQAEQQSGNPDKHSSDSSLSNSSDDALLPHATVVACKHGPTTTKT